MRGGGRPEQPFSFFRQIECINRRVLGSIRREIQCRPAIEGPDLEDRTRLVVSNDLDDRGELTDRDISVGPCRFAQLDRVVRAASASLPSVRQPVLFVQSRQDNRIPASVAASAFEKIGSTDKTLHWVQETGHVLTVDYGHEALERLTADWLEDRLP